MKSKFLLLGLVLTLLFSLNACKSKESAYKAAYEAAKEKETVEVIVVEEVTPVEKSRPTTTSSAVTQKEKVTPVDYNGMKNFNVVVGSFVNRTNATSLKENMTKAGYNAFLAQNEKGMYRVIIATFDNKSDAANLRDEVKKKYYPNQFQDAWILEQTN
jgi:Sporulation related domain.